MARAILLVVLLFAALFLVRTLRALVMQWLGRAGPARRPPPVEGEMARDPVCGAWFDRRLAVAAGSGAGRVEVCSEACRRRLEAG
jgi:hypothetical protein